MKSIFAVLLLNWLVVQGAMAFTYSALGYPRGETGCVESAILLGHKLSAATGVKIDRATCEREHDQSFDLQLQYSGNQLPLVSTESGSSYAGTYASLSDCQADLGNQVAQFESRTKLRPFHSYCYLDESGIQKSIGAKIDAFGSPVEKPQVFQSYLFSPATNPRLVEEDITRAIKERGLEVSVVKVMPAPDSLGFSRIVAKYYGSEALIFSLKKDEFLFGSKQACEQQLTAIKSMLAAQGISVSSGFCTWKGFDQRAAINFLAKWDAPWYRFHVAGDRFRTLEACLANQDRILNYFKNTLKEPAFGAVCGQERKFTSSLRSDYRVEVLVPCAKFSSEECRRPIFGME